MRTPEPLPEPLVPLNTPSIGLAAAGGKGANLVKLKQAGFPVPGGFLIPTTAYQDYISDNHLSSRIQSILDHMDPSSPSDLERASSQIRYEFSQGHTSPQLIDALKAGWQWVDETPVAVRSSATAEDLPEMSFAGQQDSFLNVIGEAALLQAVVNCWSSLWTARAIGYRTRNKIPHTEVSLSIIVQQMVQSQSSGVLFTANPLTGLRTEVVIDATYGLGEALVSGQVEPDHFVVDSITSKIISRSLGSKTVIIHGQPEGGIQSQSSDSSQQDQAIPDEVILQLAQMGKTIELLYDFPQDIEWAWAENEVYILQSRPITSLFPIPETPKSEHLEVFFSFGAVQGLLEPMTPLGHDAIRLIFAGGASLFGFEGQDQHSQTVIKIAGERLWANITGILRHPLGAKFLPKVFPGIEPGSLSALQEILSDPQMNAGSGKIRLSTISRIIKFYRRIIKRSLYIARKPEGKAAEIKLAYQAQVDQLHEKAKDLSTPAMTLLNNLDLFRELYGGFIYGIPEIMAGALPGLIPLLFLSKISRQLMGSNNLALELTRGLPNNVTTEMDLELWNTAKIIREDPLSFEFLTLNRSDYLAECWLNNQLPDVAQAQMDLFLSIYGMRGLGEIDIGRPRWRENPTQIFNSIQSYLKIEDATFAPDAVFKRGEQQAELALKTLLTEARKTFGGKLKARVIKSTAQRVRELAGLRESPKFYIIQMMGVIRKRLLESGKYFVEQGKLSKNDDLFFLYLDEIQAFSKSEERDWQSLIQKRRESYQRELLRRQIPRLLVSDGRAFYEGMTQKDLGEGIFQGSPVSPGVVEGVVKVVLDPHDSNLLPGEILVCPGTDPAWTPLFLAASGLIMEVGGLMTHGAIVAREYGIPAVVGVNKATELLQTGQRIRLNGSTGLIESLD